MTGDPDLEYVPKRTTIQRSSGSWITDGFLPNKQITIDSVDYTVIEVTASELLLFESYDIAPASVSGETVSSEIGTTTARMEFTGQQQAVLPEIDWNGGNWAAQGFAAGDSITISGADQGANNGTFVIDVIDSGDAGIIRLVTGTTLSDDASDADNSLTVEKDIAVANGVALTFVAEVTAGGVVTAQATVSRDSGSWLTAGLRTGQEITLTSAGTNSGSYIIAAVDATTISLVDGSVVTAATDADGATVTLSVAISDNVGFAAEDFYEDAQVTLSSGTWADDYQVGHTIAISGADVSANNGSYIILSKSGDTLTIDSDVTTDASDTGLATTATVTATAITDLTYSTNNAYIERTDGSSWLDDGFQGGQALFVSDSSASGSENNDGEYLVTTVTDSVLTLSSGDELLRDSETGSATDIATPAVASVSAIAGKELQFIQGTAGSLDKVVLSDNTTGELWVDFGFTEGQYIQIVGSQAGNDGLYKINIVSADTLVLAAGYAAFQSDETYTATQDRNVFALSTQPVDQQVALAANTELNFSAADNRIVRTSGDWEADGFQANQYIVINGTANGNDGTYRIISIDTVANALVLDGSDRLSGDESNAGGINIYGTTILPGSISDLIYRSDGVDMPVVSQEDLGANIVAEIERLEAEKAKFGAEGSAALVGLDAQIDQLVYQLDELGLLSPDGSVIAGMLVNFIETPEIVAKTGDVVISGDTLTGTGDLVAPGDTRITIENHSPYYLRINNDLTVTGGGGNVTFNGARVYDNADIQQRNRSGLQADFGTVLTAESTADPLIEIRNTFNPPPSGTFATAPPPDIEIIGATIPLPSRRFRPRPSKLKLVAMW